MGSWEFFFTWYNYFLYVDSQCSNGGINCQNGGICVTTPAGMAMCKCLPGFSGDECQSEYEAHTHTHTECKVLNICNTVI